MSALYTPAELVRHLSRKTYKWTSLFEAKLSEEHAHDQYGAPCILRCRFGGCVLLPFTVSNSAQPDMLSGTGAHGAESSLPTVTVTVERDALGIEKAEKLVCIRANVRDSDSGSESDENARAHSHQQGPLILERAPGTAVDLGPAVNLVPKCDSEG